MKFTSSPIAPSLSGECRLPTRPAFTARTGNMAGLTIPAGLGRLVDVNRLNNQALVPLLDEWGRYNTSNENNC